MRSYKGLYHAHKKFHSIYLIPKVSIFSCSCYEKKMFKWLFKHSKIEIFLYSIWQNFNRRIRAHTDRRHNYRLQVVGFSLRIQPLDKTDSKPSLVRIIILNQRS